MEALVLSYIGDHDTFKQPYKLINCVTHVIGSTNLKRCSLLLYTVTFGFTPRPRGKLTLYFFLVLGPTFDGHLGLYLCQKKYWSCFREDVESHATNLFPL